MNDITWCTNEECKRDCFRKQKSTEEYASYCEFVGGLDCPFFIPNE